jgi:hypothetical protein
MGVAVETEFGIIIGACEGAARTPLGPKMLDREAGPGEIDPGEGCAENNDSELWACAEAAFRARMPKINANAGPSRPTAAAIAVAGLMTGFFSA